MAAGGGDQLGRGVRAGVRRDAPGGELVGRPSDAVDGAEDLDGCPPGLERLAEGETANQVPDTAQRPGVAAQPDA
ncbi:hypothetical protein O3597_16090 [Verrucosispora sp. WMMA2044]|uniref:hypothetical protein n=1 Tax=Verrucosispora sp. WMMA2044 TaxID=3016419 RepID=UPI00248CEA15|nr:hypothetical protein [Verrucosispora sp. WMMA2044]WBB46709.1 hypothetical protein O3597_16090 [Verrucosispora sp. WMMA2044]